MKALLFNDNHSELLYEKTNRKFNEMIKIYDLTMKGMIGGGTKRKSHGIDFRFRILNRHVFKVLYWIIGYGQVHLLSSVINLAHDKTLGDNRNIPSQDADVTKASDIMFNMNMKSQALCLLLACSSCKVAMVTLVLNHVNPKCINHRFDDNEGYTPLSVASAYGCNDIVDVLLRKGASDIQNGAIWCACALGHDEVVENLITHGCDVNLSPNRVPLLVVASCVNNIEIVKNLISHDAIVDRCDYNGRSPLYHVSGLGHLEVMKFLIECRADVNLCTNDDVSPLSCAAKEGRLEVVRCLIENGADVNVGISCLSAACSGGHLDVVKYLIDKINVNQVDVLCDPALHAASSCGHLDIVKYLVEHGADINLLSSSNDSSLYCAAEKGELAVVEYLIQHGADVNQGLEIAIQCGHEELVDYMLDYSI